MKAEKAQKKYQVDGKSCLINFSSNVKIQLSLISIKCKKT